MSNLSTLLPILEHGEMSLEGQFLWGSNYTLLVHLTFQGETRKAVYKPTHGERPLWDFPSATLAYREVATYLVSECLGWQLVPPTVYRQEGLYGPGSVQLFIEHDPEYHYFNFTPADRQRLRPVALFDLIINNADRKGGHLLIDPEGHLWVIDHGICFHAEPKLRTVIWDFAGEPFPPPLCDDLHKFRCELEPNTAFIRTLQDYLTRGEIQALIRRVDHLITTQTFPHPPKGVRPYPWPLV